LYCFSVTDKQSKYDVIRMSLNEHLALTALVNHGNMSELSSNVV
jgi:hypothetical protein